MKTKTTKWVKLGERFCIAGVKYSDYLCVIKRIKRGSLVSFIGEPHNKFDNKAIRIECEGVSIGYVPAASIEKNLLWFAHNMKRKCFGVITSVNPTNPTHSMFVVEAKALNVTGSYDRKF